MEGASKQRPPLNERQLANLARGRTLNAEARARRERRDAEREADGIGEPPSIDPVELGGGAGHPNDGGQSGESGGGGSRSEPGAGGGGWRSLFGGGGAKPARKRSARKTEKALDLSGVESLLLSIHLALSIKLAAPELELTPDEAQRLGKAASEVAKHYPLIATARAQAWGQLMIVAGMVYVPRGIAIWHRKADSAPTSGTMDAPIAAGNGAGAQQQRPAATPSELDPLASLAGQTAVGAA